jgi:hypothetical protein
MADEAARLYLQVIGGRSGMPPFRATPRVSFQKAHKLIQINGGVILSAQPCILENRITPAVKRKQLLLV